MQHGEYHTARHRILKVTKCCLPGVTCVIVVQVGYNSILLHAEMFCDPMAKKGTMWHTFIGTSFRY